MPPVLPASLSPVRRLSLAGTAVTGKILEKAVLAKIFRRPDGVASALDRRLLEWNHARMMRGLDQIGRTKPATSSAPSAPTGVHNAHVSLTPSDSAWRTEANGEIARLHAALGTDAVVHHIGSTAIRELTAKPIIDLAVTLPTDRFEALLPASMRSLHGLDYRYVGIRGGCFFEKGPHPIRTHALQVHPSDSAVLADMLKFRALLQDDAAVRGRYAAIKASLASAFPRQRVFYAIYKSHWIDELQWRDSAVPRWGDWFLAQERTQDRLARAISRLH